MFVEGFLGEDGSLGAEIAGEFRLEFSDGDEGIVDYVTTADSPLCGENLHVIGEVLADKGDVWIGADCGDGLDYGGKGGRIVFLDRDGDGFKRVNGECDAGNAGVDPAFDVDRGPLAGLDSLEPVDILGWSEVGEETASG